MTEVQTGARSLLPGERRQMTVMFCDLVDSTRISETLDLEQTREVLLEYQDVAADPVRRYNGYIAQYLGDGLLVYFGYPRAHEDAARRALLTGLEIIAAIEALSPQIEARFGVQLRVRVGVHTGEVVVGEMRSGTGAVGPTPNIAARLQGLAQPNTMVTSAATRDLAEGYFNYEDLGLQEIRGIAQPLPLYRVASTTGAQSRLATRRVLWPIAGREVERRRLDQAWKQVAESQAVKPIVLVGRAGIGKSRLVRYVRTHVERGGGEVLEGYCSAYHTETPFYAITQIVEQACGIVGSDPLPTRLLKIEQRLELDGMPAESVPIVATLLSVPLSAPHQPLQLSPDAFRARAIETLGQWLDHIRDGRPVMLIIEDLHWADESTAELMNRLVATSRPGLLTLMTTRPESRIDLSSENVDLITLEPLDSDTCKEMLGWLMEGQRLAPELESLVLDRSDGVPLFLEELARAYAHPGSATSTSVPPSLRDMVTEQLERPGVDKELAQMAATIGVKAPLALLQVVAQTDRESLLRRLEGLTATGVLERDHTAADESYTFRHVLVRDEAYGLQLEDQRRSMHERIALALEAAPERLVRPELLGLHFLNATVWDKAAAYYQQAGAQAQASAAYKESISHFTEALKATLKLPDGPLRDNTELFIRLGRSYSYTSIAGYAAFELTEDMQRSLDLCREVAPSAPVLAALTVLWAFRAVRGDLDEADEVLADAYHVIQLPELELFRPEIEICRAYQHFYRGRFPECVATLREAVPSYHARLQQGVTSFWPLPNDPGVAGLALMACSAWITGHHDEVQAILDEAQTRASQMPFPVGVFSLAYAHTYASYLKHIAGDDASARTLGEQALAIGTQHGYLFWQICGSILTLTSRAMLSAPEEATALASQLEGALVIYEATGTQTFLTSDLGYLAEVQRRAAHPELALQILERAFAQTNRGERFHLCELLRFRAEAALEVDPSAHAVATDLLMQAIALAKEQGARSFQVRAALSLLQALPAGADQGSARAHLHEAIDSFPHGVAWAELEAARQVLAT